MNKYRLSIMLAIIFMVFLYIIGFIKMSEVTNFSLTLSALIFSISSVVDTFSKEDKFESKVRFLLDTIAIFVVIIIPNLSNSLLVDNIMEKLDSNILLLLALFFTLAGQWATEIKLKDIQNKQKK